SRSSQWPLAIGGGGRAPEMLMHAGQSGVAVGTACACTVPNGPGGKSKEGTTVRVVEARAPGTKARIVLAPGLISCSLVFLAVPSLPRSVLLRPACRLCHELSFRLIHHSFVVGAAESDAIA